MRPSPKPLLLFVNRNKPFPTVHNLSLIHILTTLCYIEKDGSYLMLHRVKKDKDVNKDKWIGVGGHFEKNESPEECLLREVKDVYKRQVYRPRLLACGR